jgi:hypothetical protein
MDTNALYEERLLVFVETGPQTDKYHQVLLGKDQFKKVSDAIIKTKEKCEDLREGVESVTLETSEEEYLLPDLQSINS